MLTATGYRCDICGEVMREPLRLYFDARDVAPLLDTDCPELVPSFRQEADGRVRFDLCAQCGRPVLGVDSGGSRFFMRSGAVAAVTPFPVRLMPASYFLGATCVWWGGDAGDWPIALYSAFVGFVFCAVARTLCDGIEAHHCFTAFERVFGLLCVGLPICVRAVCRHHNLKLRGAAHNQV